MKKVNWFALLAVCFIIFPFSVYAGGSRNISLDIENKTGAAIKEIIVTEINSKKRPLHVQKNTENNNIAAIKISKKTLYNIALIDINEREYGRDIHSRDADMTVSFTRSDLMDVLLTIENRTGTLITEIIITEINSQNTPVSYIRNITNNAGTEIKLKRHTLYGIILINTDERQYAKERRGWEDDATIRFTRGDGQDRNIWDKLARVFFWPAFL